MVFEKYNYQCNYCGDIDDLHIDHIFPFSKYRDNSFENLQILCRDCNLKKGDLEPDPKLHPELFGENAKGSNWLYRIFFKVRTFDCFIFHNELDILKLLKVIYIKI